LSHLTDNVQRFDDTSMLMRSDLTLEMWKAGTAEAPDRLCLPEVDQRTLEELKFSDDDEALPERLATATLAAQGWQTSARRHGSSPSPLALPSSVTFMLA
jgi:ATP-dependent Lhr-like helicase